MSIQTIASKSLLGALTIVTLSSASLATGDPQLKLNADIAKKAPLTTISLSQVSIFKKTPKTFVAKGLLNPNTGKSTSADTNITFTVESEGKTVTRTMKASEYYAQVNANEQEFNKLGYSLYDDAATPVLLQTMSPDESKLNTQKTNAPKSTGGKQSKDQKTKRFGTSSLSIPLTSVPTQTVQIKPGIIPVSVKHNEHKKWEFGDEKSFQAYLEVHANAEGVFYGSEHSGDIVDKNHCSFHADGTLGAAVLGANFKILEANADFNCPENNGSLTAKANITVLGQSVWNLNEKAPTSWNRHDEFSKKASYGVPFRVPVGPISVKGEVGVTGTVGFRYDVSLSRSGLSATGTPFANVTGYGEAGVDILVAGAGVGASITVCNAEVDLSNNMTIKWSGNKLNLQDDFSVDYDVHFLDGRMYCYAYVVVPNFSITNPFVKKRFEHNFFKWSGYQLSGNIVNLSKTISIQ